MKAQARQNRHVTSQAAMPPWILNSPASVKQLKLLPTSLENGVQRTKFIGVNHLMLVNISGCKLNLIQGDITEQQVDAIVNAANSDLAGGSGVDGAIHSAGGPAIIQETSALYPDGCPTGSAVDSKAGNLSAGHIFHAVGPVWRGGKEGEPELLQKAYRKCLQLAVKHNCQTVAFPAISAGAYGYPLDLAANVALKTVTDFQKWHKKPPEVRFVLFTEGIYGAFARSLETLIEIQ